MKLDITSEENFFCFFRCTPCGRGVFDVKKNSEKSAISSDVTFLIYSEIILYESNCIGNEGSSSISSYLTIINLSGGNFAFNHECIC